jgi:ribose-phosphate pyrophosphokinase
MVFSGNANLRLASSIAHELNVPMGRAVVGRFSDGEVMVEVMDNVRGADVYVIQPTSAPTADNFMELLVPDHCQGGRHHDFRGGH